MGRDEKELNKDLKAMSKIGTDRELTTRMKAAVLAIDGNEDRGLIGNFIDNMLSRDALAFRKHLRELQPDIEVKQNIETEEGNTVEVAIPMTVNFFWPSD